MPLAESLIGLAFGVLLTAAGLALWNNTRNAVGVSRATLGVTWIAGGILAVATLFLRLAGHDLGLRLAGMAAIAAPLSLHHRRPHMPWRSAASMLPALTATGTCLLVTSGLAPGWTPRTLSPLAGWGLTICAGLAARALGEALSSLVKPVALALYAPGVLTLLLTGLAGGAALINLYRRGVAWGGGSSVNGWTGAWMAWSAVWLSKRQRPRLQAALTILAALLLIATAMQ